MKNLLFPKFTKDDYKTMAAFILTGSAVFFIGYFFYQRPVEEIGNAFKIIGAGSLIYFLKKRWIDFPVLPRVAWMLGLTGVIIASLLHAYKVWFTNQPQNYSVNMSFHLTMITLYIGVYAYALYRLENKKD